MPQDRLADYGLDEPKATLVIVRKGRPERTFEVGGETYGTRDKYVRDAESGKIYLVDDQVLRPLQYARTRLPERNLLPVEPEEIVKLTIQGPAGSLELEHRNREDKKAEAWVRAGTDTADDAAETWLEKVFRLKSTGYVQPDETPTGLETAFSLAVEDADGVTTHLEILKGRDEKGNEAWYARSEHTRGLVKLHKVLASEAAEDLGTLFAE